MKKTLSLSREDLSQSKKNLPFEEIKLADFVAIFHLTVDYDKVVFRDGKQEKTLKNK